jgi:hypothetical protein
MPDNISLLPEGMRKKEEDFKKTEPPKADTGPADLRFSTPVEEGEDVEVIEIDEGEVEQVLASEPWLTRVMYQASGFFDTLRTKLFQPGTPEPPPKLPPQFFAPPSAKPAPSVVPPGETVTPRATAQTPVGEPATAKAKARIIPAEKTPRRVRVIRRVRKPVRVSLVSEEDLRLLHIDIPKRKFTLVTLVILFGIIVAGGAYALSRQQAEADAELALAKQQVADVRSAIQQKQQEWSAYQDLEPRLKALIGLLDQHVSPTGLLQLLEQNTLTTVTYDAFLLSPDRKLTLGVVTDSYESAAKQVVAFEKSGIAKKVDASGYTARYDEEHPLTPTSVRFQLVLLLADRALK